MSNEDDTAPLDAVGGSGVVGVPGEISGGIDFVELVGGLLERIDALQGLLACYRTGAQPRERIFEALDETKEIEKIAREMVGDA